LKLALRCSETLLVAVAAVGVPPVALPLDASDLQPPMVIAAAMPSMPAEILVSFTAISE
jgi:hypothetical protein